MRKYGFIFIIFFLTSCVCFECHGPFHHDAYITIPSKIINIEDKLFCIADNALYELNNDTFIKCEFVNNVNDIYYANDKVVISTKDTILIYDNNFSTLFGKLNVHACSALICDNTICYTAYENGEITLYAYNLVTEKQTLIATNFYDGEYKVGDKTIYSNSEGYLSLEYPLHNIVNNGFAYDDSISIKHNKDFVSITLLDNKIEIVYKDNFIDMPSFAYNAFFDNLYIINQKLYFAVFDLKHNDDCVARRCICHVGKSRIFSFDFEKEELKLEHELNERSYLISIDGNGICYYYDGYIYQNGNKICEVNKVEPYGEYELYGSKDQVSSGKRSIYRAMFLMHKNSIYVDFADFSYLLEDKYYS